MNIIFRPHFFGGKNNNFDDIFVPMSLKSVLKYNPKNTIYFISNDKNFLQKNFPMEAPTNLKCYLFEEFEDENTKEFDKNYIHLSTNQLLFEKWCILSYFYIYNLMCKFNIDEVIVVETDVLIFCNLEETFVKNYNLIESDAILYDKHTMASSFCKKIYFETFINSALKMYSDIIILKNIKNIKSNLENNKINGGICDMTINDWINYNKINFKNMNNLKKDINITELSLILEDNSFFDEKITKIEYQDKLFDFEDNKRDGKIKKIYNINNQPYFKYDDKFIKCNSIHFNGDRKKLIPEIYNEYINIK